ncbi:MAG: hypothetical protein ACLSA6_05235 [Holdemania massiliensis]
MIIQSTQVWINDGFQPGQLEIAGGRIEAVLPYGEKPVDQDYQDQWILPGFIDIHTHGWNRCDAGKPTVEAMLRWQKHMPKEGVTSFSDNRNPERGGQRSRAADSEGSDRSSGCRCGNSRHQHGRKFHLPSVHGRRIYTQLSNRIRSSCCTIRI